MKVICIQEARHNHVTLEEKESPIKVGNEYRVLHQQEEFGKLYYALIEFGMDLGISAECFAPLSNIDETELVNKLEISDFTPNPSNY